PQRPALPSSNGRAGDVQATGPRTSDWSSLRCLSTSPSFPSARLAHLHSPPPPLRVHCRITPPTLYQRTTKRSSSAPFCVPPECVPCCRLFRATESPRHRHQARGDYRHAPPNISREAG